MFGEFGIACSRSIIGLGVLFESITSDISGVATGGSIRFGLIDDSVDVCVGTDNDSVN